MDDTRNSKTGLNSLYSGTYFPSNNYNSSLSMSGNDMETEQEAINMIRSQNRKIQELYAELESRDIALQNFQSQVSSGENYKLQMENYKRQVGIQEEKLRLYENDFSSKSNFLSEQLKHVSDAENKLRNQMVTKDKIIRDYDNAIKEQEKHLTHLKKQLVEKDSVYSELKQDFLEITAKFKNLTLKLNMKEEENKKIRDDLDFRLSEVSKEKCHLEDKLAQLIDIVKQYSKELSEYNVQIQALETERRSMQKVNNRLTEELEEGHRNISELQNEVYAMKELQSRLSNAENVIDQLEHAIENEKLKSESLHRVNNELNEKFSLIKDRHSGENSLENLKGLISQTQIENENLQEAVESLTRSNKASENKILNLESENKEVSNALNNEFKSIIQWIDTYLVVFYDQHFEIPDLPLTINKAVKTRFKVDALKDALYKSRKIINSELNKYEQVIKEAKKEASETMYKQEKYIREISDLKNQILNKNEEVYSLNQEMEAYHSQFNQNKAEISKIKTEVTEKHEQNNRFLEKLFTNTQKELEAILRNDTLKTFYDYVYRPNYSDNLKSQIEDNIDKLIQILNGVLREYEIALTKSTESKLENEKLKREVNEKTKQCKEEVDAALRGKESSVIQSYEKSKFEELRMNENLMAKNMEKMRNQIIEKDELVLQMQHENSLLKNQMELLEQKVNTSNNRKELEYDLQENYDKLNDTCKALDKKCRNLTTEIDLKDMQIKSQEQMIARRTAEINEMKVEIGVATGENFDKENIKVLENDKDKLLKDNLSLMNANYMLNNQVNVLKAQLGQTSKNHYAVDEDLIKQLNERLKLSEEDLKNKENTIRRLLNERKK